MSHYDHTDSVVFEEDELLLRHLRAVQVETDMTPEERERAERKRDFAYMDSFGYAGDLYERRREYPQINGEEKALGALLALELIEGKWFSARITAKGRRVLKLHEETKIGLTALLLILSGEEHSTSSQMLTIAAIIEVGGIVRVKMRGKKMNWCAELAGEELDSDLLAQLAVYEQVKVQIHRGSLPQDQYMRFNEAGVLIGAFQAASRRQRELTQAIRGKVNTSCANGRRDQVIKALLVALAHRVCFAGINDGKFYYGGTRRYRDIAKFSVLAGKEALDAVCALPHDIAFQKPDGKWAEIQVLNMATRVTPDLLEQAGLTKLKEKLEEQNRKRKAIETEKAEAERKEREQLEMLERIEKQSEKLKDRIAQEFPVLTDRQLDDVVGVALALQQQDNTTSVRRNIDTEVRKHGTDDEWGYSGVTIRSLQTDESLKPKDFGFASTSFSSRGYWPGLDSRLEANALSTALALLENDVIQRPATVDDAIIAFTDVGKRYFSHEGCVGKPRMSGSDWKRFQEGERIPLTCPVCAAQGTVVSSGSAPFSIFN